MVGFQPCTDRSLLKRQTFSCDGCDDDCTYDDDIGDDSDGYDIAGPKMNPLSAECLFFQPLVYSCVMCHWVIYWSQIDVC
jgi:hypothetical protein